MSNHHLNQVHAQFFAFMTHIVGPDAGLDLTDVSLVEQYHAETTLTDTATDAQRQFVVQQLLMEVECLAVFLVFNLQLTQQ